MIELMEKKANVVFVDETCFTTNQVKSNAWWKTGDPSPEYEVNSLRFRCVAVVGAIDLQGNLVALQMDDRAIKVPQFKEFLEKLKAAVPASPTYVLLDNLNVHHNKEVKELAKSLGLEFIFNAAYYSHVNVIERLWCYSKRAFQRKIIDEPNWKDHDKVKDLVIECLKGVKPSTLAAYA